MFNEDFPALANIRGALITKKFRVSPKDHISLQAEARELAGIPPEAVSFAMSYPAALDWSALPAGIELSEPACLVAMTGGFVYFDASRQPCALMAIRGLVDQLEGHACHSPSV